LKKYLAVLRLELGQNVAFRIDFLPVQTIRNTVAKITQLSHSADITKMGIAPMEEPAEPLNEARPKIPDEAVAPRRNPPETLSFSYVKRPGLLKLTIVNFLLSLVTFSIYRFWAKNNVRKHIWSSVHINGEPLEYTGTGKELFTGAMVVFGILILPILLLQVVVAFVYGPESFASDVVSYIFTILLFVFWGFAVYRARKFQLSRTQWRGIRGTLVGSAMTYSMTYFGSLIAKTLSLGWATPVMNTVLQEQIIGDMRFGDAAFKFKGRASPLYSTFAMCWLLSALALLALPFLMTRFIGTSLSELYDTFAAGPDSLSMDETFWMYFALAVVGAFIAYMLIIPMLWAVYSAKELRTFANYTRFDGAQFHLQATTGSVIWLTAVNVVILIFTLGIGWPFVQQRLVRFMVDRMSLEGAIDVSRIQQSLAEKPTRGEGLADAFDVGGL
jgi:uncharacterized membrane protein YjgN (DUF898 family)